MIPDALAHVEHFAAHRERLCIFLDYDGTLTPIVDQPELAILNDSTREVMRSLAKRVPVAILSGRDLGDLQERVKIDNIIYAGSHGFEIAGPRRLGKEVGTEFLPDIDVAEKELQQKLAEIPGARVERKRFCVAVHYRNVKERDVARIEPVVNQIAAHHRKLRRLDNKKVYELQPNVDWDKGKTVRWILDSVGRDRPKPFPIYIGDDRTDETAFDLIREAGAGIIVAHEPRSTAAHYSLKDPAEVECFLRGLAELLPVRT